MLFTARPPLPYLKPPIKPRCRNIDSICNNTANYLDKFEETPEEYEEVPVPRTKKQKDKEILIEKLKTRQRENIE